MSQKEWRGKILEQRIRNRKDYMQGPKSSPQQWQTYVDLFKAFLNDKKAPVVLVLGSTPELRDLALSYPAVELLTVDINPGMVEQMSKLMANQNSPRETFIPSDWLNMPISDNGVDLIVGDGAIANLPAGQFDNFFQQARRIVKPDGFLILRDGVRIKELISPPEKIIEQSRQDNWHWFDLFSYLDFSSTGDWYDEKTNQADMARWYQWVEEKYRQGILNDDEFSNLWPWRGNLVHTILPVNIFSKIFSKYFKTIKVNQPNDLRYHKFINFFVGQPKKQIWKNIPKKE